MDFKSVRETIDFAVGREKQAAELYELFGRKSEKPATRAMFEALAAEERRHREVLEALTAKQLSDLGRKKLPVRETETLSDVKFEPDMDFVDALKLAIEREEESLQLYRRLHAVSGDPAVKHLFEVLVEQERSHKAKLQDEYDSIVLKDY